MDDLDDTYVIKITLTHSELETIMKHLNKTNTTLRRSNVADFLYDTILDSIEELRSGQSTQHSKRDYEW